MKVAAKKGPLPANTPQAANPERMSAVVAVSRGPHRSAAHNSGTTARNPSALLNAVCSISGLKAITPTTPAAASTVADASTVFRLKGRKSPRAQSTTTGATARTPAASRSHHVVHAAMMPVHSRYPASDKPTDAGSRADHRRGENDQGEFRNAGRRIESVAAAAPDADQVPADDWRQSAARCDDQGHRNGVGGARIGEVGGYARHICRCKNRRPHANSAQEDGGEGETSRRPDRDHARVDRRDRQAEIRQTKIGCGNDYQRERIDRQTTWIQRRKKLSPR